MKILLLLAVSALFAQADEVRYSSTTGDVSLSSASTKFTLQTGSTGRQVTLESAVIYCSVACDVTQSHNGSAATATLGVVSGLPPAGGPPATATTYTASNVGSGTAVGGIFHIPATTTVVLDLSKITIPRSSNYTVIVGTITGTANVTFFWSEK